MLKFSYKTKAEIPEGQEAFYVEKDGAFFLQVDGAVAKETLTEFRTNNITLTQEAKTLREQLAKFKDVDPEKYAEAMQKLQAIDDKKLIDAGEIDKVVEQRVERMRNDFTAQIDAMTTKLENQTKIAETATGKLSKLTLETEVTKAISDTALPKKGALSDIIARAKNTFTVNEDGLLVAMDGDTKKFNSEGKDFTLGDFTADLIKTAPYLFETASGSGANGSTTVVNGQTLMNKTDLDGTSASDDVLEKLADGSLTVTDG